MFSRLYLIIIFFVIVGVLGFFLVWPAYQKMLSTQEEIEEIEASIQRGEAYYANLRSISEKLEDYQEQFKVIDSALPKKSYIPHLYDFFQKTCSRNGLTLEGIGHSVEGTKEREDIKEIGINLKVLGTYSSFKNYLDYLGKSVRFFSIRNITLAAPTEGEPFNFSISIKTFSY